MKVGQKVKLLGEFYNGIYGTLLEVKEQIHDLSGTRFSSNPTLYLVEINIPNKGTENTICHKLWLKEEDLE